MDFVLLGGRRPDDTDLHTPFLCDIEFLHTTARFVRAKALNAGAAADACVEYALLHVTRHPHLPLMGRILELRHNFSAYDASYVALAEQLETPLVTADQRLARAVRRHLPHVEARLS